MCYVISSFIKSNSIINFQLFCNTLARCTIFYYYYFFSVMYVVEGSCSKIRREDHLVVSTKLQISFSHSLSFELQILTTTTWEKLKNSDRSIKLKIITMYIEYRISNSNSFQHITSNESQFIIDLYLFLPLLYGINKVYQ